MCLWLHACVLYPAHWVPLCQERYVLQLRISLPWQLKPSSSVSFLVWLPDTARASGMPADAGRSYGLLKCDPEGRPC